MSAGTRPKTESLFVSGDYVRYFRPDDSSNPFQKLYGEKRQAVIDLLPGTGLNVLDVGSGMGRIAIPLAQRHAVTACDLSWHMLRLASDDSGGKLSSLAVADARRLPFADRSFDAALCIDVLPHLSDPALALSEARRVLRPGGTFIVDSTNSMPLWTLAYPHYLGRRPARWVGIWRSGGVLPEWSSRVWHRGFGTFMKLLDQAGFSVKSVHNFGPRICPKWHMAVAV
jgi:ubiquinone/menaquinone biosynthesis C-methylase UbiE